MATGKSGIIELSGTNYISAKIHWAETYDVASNKSSVQITKIEIASSEYYGVTYYLNGAISIGNSIAVSMNSTSGTHRATIQAKNKYFAVSGDLGAVGDIAHNEDGSKALTISIAMRGYTTSGGGGSGWSISGGQSIVLTTIPRKSTVSAENGTLGIEQTITISKQSPNFIHSVHFAVNGQSGGTIASRTGETSIRWIPPIDLAGYNPNGQSVAIELICETFSNGSSIGTNSTTISCQIPSSQASPDFSMALSDEMGYKDTFGGYVQNRSRLNVAGSAVPKYGATIQSGIVTFDNRSADWRNAVFDITNASSTRVTAEVVDSRGFTAGSDVEIPVLPYSNPGITAISAYRCDENGNSNSGGAYMRIIFSASISPLNDKNSATYTLQYRKKGESGWKSEPTSASGYDPTDISVIVAAETESSYEARIEAEDYFGPIYSAIRTVQSSYALVHLSKNGNCIGVGKVAERNNTLDVGLGIHMNDHSIEDIRSLYIRAQDDGNETGDVVFSRPINYGFEARLDVVHNFFRLYSLDKSGNPATHFQFQMDDPELWIKGGLRLDKPLSIANGGTGAATVADARANLGMGDLGVYSGFHDLSSDGLGVWGNVSVVSYGNNRAHIRINGFMKGENDPEKYSGISVAKLNDVLTGALGRQVSISRLLTSDYMCYDDRTGAPIRDLFGWGTVCTMNATGIYFGRYANTDGDYGDWPVSRFYQDGGGVQFYLDMVVSVTES